MRLRRATSLPFHKREAIHARQFQVEQDDIGNAPLSKGWPAFEVLDCLLTVLHPIDRKIRLASELLFDEQSVISQILDQETTLDFLGRHTS